MKQNVSLRLHVMKSSIKCFQTKKIQKDASEKYYFLNTKYNQALLPHQIKGNKIFMQCQVLISDEIPGMPRMQQSVWKQCTSTAETKITLTNFPTAVKCFSLADSSLSKFGGAQYCSYFNRGNANSL